MLCARSFKNHTFVASKITHFSPSRASHSRRHPRPNPPHKDSFLPHQPSFLSRRLSRQKLSHSHSRPSPTHAHPFHAGTPPERSQEPHTPPSSFPLEPFSEAFQSSSQRLLRVPPESLLSVVLHRFQGDASGEKGRFLRCGFRDAGQIARGVPGVREENRLVHAGTPPERSQRLLRRLSFYISLLRVPQRPFSEPSQRSSGAALRDFSESPPIPLIRCAATVPGGYTRRKRSFFVRFQRRRTDCQGRAWRVRGCRGRTHVLPR